MRARVGCRQLAVGNGRDADDAAAGDQKESRGCKCDECDEQCVFDQVLPLIIVPKVSKGSHRFPVTVGDRLEDARPRPQSMRKPN